MPLQRGWTKYEPKSPPNEVGVYELAYNKRLVYIGKGKIRDRIRDHDRDDEISFTHYRCKVTNNRRRAGQIKRKELKNYGSSEDELPKHNHRMG